MPRKKSTRGVADRARDDAGLPVSEHPEITQTSIYPTVHAMYHECVERLDWYPNYGPGTRRTIKYAFYAAVAETLRTVAFRMNAEQSDAVFGDLDKELRAYDQELQAIAESYTAAIQ